jgi:hypothetical protein
VAILSEIATSDDIDLAGYICSVDGLPVFACSSPVIIDRNILQATLVNNGGNDFSHSFQVSTIDTSGNIEPTPAVFHWIATDTILPETIITPEGLPQETITSNRIVSEFPALEALTP